jgi:sugar phosphate isomerase/epimerase
MANKWNSNSPGTGHFSVKIRIRKQRDLAGLEDGWLNSFRISVRLSASILNGNDVQEHVFRYSGMSDFMVFLIGRFQMKNKFDRRHFMTATAGATLGLSAVGVATNSLANSLPSIASGGRRDDQPLFKISLAEWSLHRSINAGVLDNLAFPKIAREEFEIGAVEYVNSFFKDKAKDESYLRQLKKTCEDHEVSSVLIMIEAVENHFRWVDAAKFLGCHSIRVNAGSSGSYDEQAKLAADGLRQLCEYAAPQEIGVIVENHGGWSSNGQWLARVIRMVNMDNCGTLPDFGNFRISSDKTYDRYIGTAALMPFAKGVSAKSHNFDENGNEKQTDYMKMLQIVIDAGYDGYIGIEFEGGGDEFEGIRATKKLLERCREALTRG